MFQKTMIYCAYLKNVFVSLQSRHLIFFVGKFFVYLFYCDFDWIFIIYLSASINENTQTQLLLSCFFK